MNIKELNKYLKIELRNKDYRISRPWELLKLRYLNRIEVYNYEMRYLIDEDGDDWKILIEERGAVIKSETFPTEKEACIFFKGLFKAKEQKSTLPNGWTETKISENTFVTKIPQEQRDNWDKERREKDKVGQLSKKDGFHDTSCGRAGTIYYVENGRVCELDYEISGVKEFDILINFDGLTEWIFPTKESISDKKAIKEKLVNWLNKKKIRAEL